MLNVEFRANLRIKLVKLEQNSSNIAKIRVRYRKNKSLNRLERFNYKVLSFF